MSTVSKLMIRIILKATLITLIGVGLIFILERYDPPFGWLLPPIVVALGIYGIISIYHSFDEILNRIVKMRQ